MPHDPLTSVWQGLFAMARNDGVGLGAERKGYVSAIREAAFSGPGKFWGVMPRPHDRALN